MFFFLFECLVECVSFRINKWKREKVKSLDLLNVLRFGGCDEAQEIVAIQNFRANKAAQPAFDWLNAGPVIKARPEQLEGLSNRGGMEQLFVMYMKTSVYDEAICMAYYTIKLNNFLADN